MPTNSELPDLNYDGSSTKKAEGRDSEVFLRPRKMITDPFSVGNNILVLYDTWKPDGTPTNTSLSSYCEKILEPCVEEEPWFAMEQEYALYRLISILTYL